MDEGEKIGKIRELSIKYLNLKDEIKIHQKILEDMQNEILVLIKQLPFDSVVDRTNKTIVTLKSEENESFDSSKFKKENPETYEQYRVSSKRFDQKKLKKKEPDLFNEYIKRTLTESLVIKKLGDKH